ncbi:Glycosyltransferase involved in cell wall bisynthesis [Halorubrum ezzemoulense]|uniref:Glycosyltransferase involved in cell wall bisynthesis n=2 Tax=Halorubrum ezzemoulense TaxID=337243 RepID=A0A238YHU5_HALEZ|nr:glycosyltransferase family 4 protein [Halorubrum ezzemoulense]SNR70291.1 Glycosyltransferase involved in cell wall bisynthesis [Halorubrum ezzemoulense]
MSKKKVIHVGPIDNPTGGISRFIDQANKNSPEYVTTTNHSRYSAESTIETILYPIINFVKLLNFLTIDYDLVHIHTSQSYSFYLSSLYVIISRKIHKKPIVIHCHGSRFDEFVKNSSGLKEKYIIQILQLADRVLVVSNDTGRAIQSISEQEPAIIRHSVELSNYEPVCSSGSLSVLFLSNLLPRKGIKEFCSVIENINKKHEYNYTVDIAGIGECEGLVECLATKEKNVKYHGFVSESKKHELINNSDIYVLPTKAEAGVPIAIVEAMAGKNALVTSDVSGINEILTESNAIFVNPNSTNQIELAISSLLENEDLVYEMGITNRELIKNKYTSEHLMNNLSKIYSPLLGLSKPSVDS